MPYRKEQFVNGEFYHIILRGVGDCLIFKDINDYYRGIFSIYEFNNAKSVSIKERRKQRQKEKAARGKTSGGLDVRDRFVNILVFCFMPNHIHLLVKQIRDNGVTKFMRKVGTGYAGYFNRKYERRGHLFQGKFSSVYIKSDDQLKTVFVYIHANPISLIEPKWKEAGVKKPQEAIKFLEEYKWSSYPDYIGKKNFPSVAERDFILEIMGDERGCKDFVENWVGYKGKIKNVGLFLE